MVAFVFIFFRRMARAMFIQRLFRSRLFLAATLGCLLLIALAFGRQAVRTHQIEQEIAGLQRQADALSADNTQIDQLQKALQTESYLEREARLKLGLEKPGEHLVVVQDKSADGPAFQGLDQLAGGGAPGSAPAAVPAAARVSNPVRWWDYFFNRQRYDALAAYASS